MHCPLIGLLIFSIAFCMCNMADASGEGKNVKYHNCKSRFTIKQVRVNPCETTDPARCPLKKGTSPSVSVTFVPNKEARNLTATVHGIINGIPVPFPLPNSIGCVNTGLTCPLVSGQEYTYTQTVPVLSSYPNLDLLIRWVLDSQTEAESENKDVCFVIRAKIVD